MLTSTTARRVAATWLAGCFVAIAAHSARADVPKSLPLADDPLQEVLDRIGGHADTDAWRKPGWKDEQIEAWLEKMVTAIAKGAEVKELALPVRQADVQPAVDGAFPPLREGMLIVGKDVQQTLVRRSIILADGDVNVSMAEDSVIVARGTANVPMSRRSVIVAGVCVNMRSDMVMGGDTLGSLVVTPGWAHVEMGHHTVLLAMQDANVRAPRDMVFINREVPPGRLVFGNANTTRSVKIADLPLQPLALHALGERLELLGIVHGDPAGAADPISRLGTPARAVVFRYEGRRYVADLGKPILDEAGQAVEALQGWKLVAVSGSVAIFSKAGTLAVAKKAAN